jgi:GNAT superfamily N-acetyltransferase
MTISIRTAVPSDIGLIHELILALAVYERLSHEVRADRATLERNLFGPSPRAEVLIAEIEARGSGAGRALLRRLAQIAIERDCARLEWWVLDWNEPALQFYRSIGARPMSEWTVQRVDGEALTALASSE